MACDRQRDAETEKMMQSLVAEIAQLKAMITSGGSFHSPILSDKASFDPDKEFKVKPPFGKGLVLQNDDDCVPLNAPPSRPQPPPKLVN